VVDGLAQVRRIIRRNGIQVVVAFGLYATLAAILAARALGLPAAIHFGPFCVHRLNPGLTEFLARESACLLLSPCLNLQTLVLFVRGSIWKALSCPWLS
jgi:hypothetical protein